LAGGRGSSSSGSRSSYSSSSSRSSYTYTTPSYSRSTVIVAGGYYGYYYGYGLYGYYYYYGGVTYVGGVSAGIIVASVVAPLVCIIIVIIAICICRRRKQELDLDPVPGDVIVIDGDSIHGVEVIEIHEERRHYVNNDNNFGVEEVTGIDRGANSYPAM